MISTKKCVRKLYRTFERDFKPIKNPFKSELDDGDLDKVFFHYRDQERQYVLDHLAKHPNTVWSVTEYEGKFYITNGMHVVNLWAYMITEVPCPADKDFDIYGV